MIRLLHLPLAVLALSVSLIFGGAAFASMDEIGASPPDKHVMLERDALFVIASVPDHDLTIPALLSDPPGHVVTLNRPTPATVQMPDRISAVTAWQPPAFRAPPRLPV